MSSILSEAFARLEFELRKQDASYVHLRRKPELSRAEIESRLVATAGPVHQDAVDWFAWQDGANPTAPESIPPIIGDLLTTSMDEYLRFDFMYRNALQIEDGTPNPWIRIAANESRSLVIHAQSGEIHVFHEWTEMKKINATLAELLDAWSDLFETYGRWNSTRLVWELDDRWRLIPDLLGRAGW